MRIVPSAAVLSLVCAGVLLAATPPAARATACTTLPAWPGDAAGAGPCRGVDGHRGDGGRAPR